MIRRIAFALLFVVALAFAQTTTYTPAFAPPVSINGPDGTSIATMNPQYCLVPSSAVSLAQLPEISPYVSGIGYAPPIQLVAVGPFSISTVCPFFVLINSAPENAGLVAQWFTHGLPYTTEVQQVIQQITEDMAAYVAGSGPKLSAVAAVPPAPAATVTPAPTPVATTTPDPVGVALPDGRYNNLAGATLAFGTTYTDSRGTFTLTGDSTPFGTIYWWVLTTPAK